MEAYELGDKKPESHNEEDLRHRLNDMFDICGAQVEKTQQCPTGRWVFSILATLLFCAVYGVLMYGAMWSYGGLLVFLIVILSVALLYVLLRIWTCFVTDLQSAKHAETITFLRKGDDRYYYTRGRHMEKFEYAGGYICVSGNSYDKFEDKSDYSPLAGRFDKALQRRSSLYSTLSPAFWFERLRLGTFTVSGSEVRGNFEGGSVRLFADENGKIAGIDYYGNGSELYDSASPIRLLDGKIPGKYKITYRFTPGEQKIALKPIFFAAMADFLMAPPPKNVIEEEV